jgi:hypothetical protein
MAVANLALRFLLELAGVGALGYWGWQATDAFPQRLLVAVFAGGSLVVVWALVVSPKASNTIPQDVRMFIGTGLLLVAAAALAVAGEPVAGLALGILVVVNQGLVLVLGRGGLEV